MNKPTRTADWKLDEDFKHSLPKGFDGWASSNVAEFDRCAWVEQGRPVPLRVAERYRETGLWWIVPNHHDDKEKPEYAPVGPFDTMEAALTALRIIDAAERT